MPLNTHYKNILALAVSYENRVRLTFLRMINRLKLSVNHEDLRLAIESGNPSLINSKIPWDQVDGELGTELKELIIQITVESNIGGAKAIGSKAVTGQSKKWASMHSAELITNVTSESKRAVRRTILNGLKNGSQIDKLAKEIIANIGLTERQSVTLDNFRRGLLAENMNIHTIDKLVNKRRKIMLNERAMIIASHETILASNSGFYEAARQSLLNGELDPATYELEWVVTKDDRLCELCKPLSGKRAQLGGEFENGFKTPPLHVGCRCTTRIVKIGSKRDRFNT
jgi:hypothetical protein